METSRTVIHYLSGAGNSLRIAREDAYVFAVAANGGSMAGTLGHVDRALRKRGRVWHSHIGRLPDRPMSYPRRCHYSAWRHERPDSHGVAFEASLEGFCRGSHCTVALRRSTGAEGAQSTKANPDCTKCLSNANARLIPKRSATADVVASV